MFILKKRNFRNLLFELSPTLQVTTLYKAVLPLSLWIKSCCYHSNERYTKQYFSDVLFNLLYKVF